VNGFLLDTNVISELIKPRPEPKVRDWIEAADEDRLFLSVVTLGEIRKGIDGLQAASSRRARLESWLESGLKARFFGRILPIDEQVADQWGIIAAASARAVRPLPVIDGLLAATAVYYDLTLVTRDTAAVAATAAIVLNPWS
jgi:toxin FitB